MNPWEAQFPHCRNIRRRTEPFVTCNRQDIQLIVFKSATSEIARHSCKSHTSFIKISHMFSGALIRHKQQVNVRLFCQRTCDKSSERTSHEHCTRQSWEIG